MNSSSADVPHGRMEDALEAVIAGEPRALDAWYRREHPLVWRLCAGFLADPTEADDVAQDAMLHLLDRLPTFDRAREWSAWRNGVVLNLCRDRRRRSDARASAENRAKAERPERFDLDPARRLERREASEQLLEILASFPEREREAFVLFELEEHSAAAIAGMMQIGESSVRSLVALARRRLRARLGALGLGPDRGAPHGT